MSTFLRGIAAATLSIAFAASAGTEPYTKAGNHKSLSACTSDNHSLYIFANPVIPPSELKGKEPPHPLAEKFLDGLQTVFANTIREVSYPDFNENSKKDPFGDFMVQAMDYVQKFQKAQHTKITWELEKIGPLSSGKASYCEINYPSKG